MWCSPFTLSKPLLRSALLGLGAFLLASAPTVAQTNITGLIFDGSGGPLLSGQTYIATGSLTVPLGQTLTVQQGVILKFNASTQISVSGTLNVDGAPGDRVSFSSAKDDTLGGDTNGDGGATLPGSGDWRGVVATANSTMDLSQVDLRYGGGASVSPVHVSSSGTAIALDGCTIKNSLVDGLQLANQTFAALSVSGCTFDDNGEYGVANVRLELLPNFSNNTASGNGVGDFVQVANGVLPASTNLVISLDQLIGDVLVMDGNATIPTTSSLTLPAGLVVKMRPSTQFTNSGSLTAIGTALSPIVFTSLHDDSFAGDTNKNGGATVPAAGNWRGLVVQSAGSLTVTDAELAYGGAASVSPVHVSSAGASLAVTDCILRDSLVDGLQLANQTFAALSVSGCTFDDNGEYGVANVRLELLPNFSNNTASGNGVGDFVQVANGVLPASTNLVISLDQLIGDVLVMDGNATIPTTSSLTLPAGLVVKMRPSTQFTNSGSLTATGTALSPIVFTSLHDDSFAGDTNKNGGATVPAAGNWRGLVVQSAGSLTVTDAELVYGGAASVSPVHVSSAGASLAVTDCILRDSLVDGLQLANQTFAALSVSGCTFDDNGEYGVANVRLELLPNFSNNTASGNGVGDFVQVANSVLPASTDLVISLDQLIGDVLVMDGNATIPTMSSLTLPAGLVVKMRPSTQFTVSGLLDVQGTGESPVTFTSLKDDAILGDTNKNGTMSVPAPGDWRGCAVSSTGTLDMDHAVLSYGGAASVALVHVTSTLAQVTLDAVRVERSLTKGFLLSAASAVRDCVAWNCGQDGFNLVNGTFDLLRCTAVANGGFGVKVATAHSGQIMSSVSFNNATANYDGVLAGELFNSLGDPALAGSNGNVNTDPLFVDEANGDLRLTALSICVDNGDPLDKPSGYDLAGFPRLMDGKLNYFRKVDMGAYEFDNIEMVVTGAPIPGGTINLVLSGKAGMDTWIFLGVATFELPFKTFGPLAVDVSQPSLIFNFLPLPSSLPLAIPLDFPVGLPVYAQALGLDGTLASDPGNMSNPVTIIVE